MVIEIHTICTYLKQKQEFKSSFKNVRIKGPYFVILLNIQLQNHNELSSSVLTLWKNTAG